MGKMQDGKGMERNKMSRDHKKPSWVVNANLLLKSPLHPKITRFQNNYSICCICSLDLLGISWYFCSMPTLIIETLYTPPSLFFRIKSSFYIIWYGSKKENMGLPENRPPQEFGWFLTILGYTCLICDIEIIWNHMKSYEIIWCTPK